MQAESRFIFESMAFTTRCYIRKNTKELRDRLKEIGYTICKCCYFNDAVWLDTLPMNGSIHGVGYLSEGVKTQEEELARYIAEDNGIDCGENEELFLAIAALNDTTDAFQWFTDGVHCEKTSRDLPSRYMQMNGKKMTVKELIEKFSIR